MLPYTTTCCVCGRPLDDPKYASLRKYCSRKCLKQVARQKQYQKRIPQQCKRCGILFHAQTEKEQPFCSKSCASLSPFGCMFKRVMPAGYGLPPRADKDMGMCRSAEGDCCRIAFPGNCTMGLFLTICLFATTAITLRVFGPIIFF
jgi:endogenous inhibitor of DNA gyrase (YacG/DUF329 family)